jgi:hypothetical protein
MISIVGKNEEWGDREIVVRMSVEDIIRLISTAKREVEHTKNLIEENPILTDTFQPRLVEFNRLKNDLILAYEMRTGVKY